jgi:hypothetical protein
MIYCQGLVRSTVSMYNGRLRVLFFFLADCPYRYPDLDPGYHLLRDVVAFVRRQNCGTCLQRLPLTQREQGHSELGYSLTKPDACELIVNLLECVYCRQCNDAGGENDRTSELRFGDPYLKASLSYSTLPTTVSMETFQQYMIQASLSEYLPATSITKEKTCTGK